MAHGEFSLITRYFDRVGVVRNDVETGIGDDCALLKVADNQLVAISTDTLVAGVHFLPDIDPADLGYKSLAVNLSDLAAMGAQPAWVTLAITLPDVDETWLAAFSDSLFDQLEHYGAQLIGGDTTQGPLAMTLSIHGLVPEGLAIKRSGAQPGDSIYVTGTLGDSAAGLAILQNHLQVNCAEYAAWLKQRHLRPQPRVIQGIALRNIASSAIDLSDGLISDLGHILKASHCGGRINIEALPISDALKNSAAPEQAIRWALSGGEDYELCFTVPAQKTTALVQALNHLQVPFTCIGSIVPVNEGLQLLQDGEEVNLTLKGYDHFAH